MHNQIELLDKGYIRLVDYMGNDASIVRSARVSHSNDGMDYDPEKDIKLINYLWKNKHTTPFESCTVTFEIKAPIFVFRQWQRHRTQSYNEISARYTELPNEYYVPDVMNVGKQSTGNKQGRNTDLTVEELQHRQNEIDVYAAYCRQATNMYKNLLTYDWPRELARMILPMSTYSRMYTTMNLLNAFKFITLRSDSHAQHEIQVYSNAMFQLLNDCYPIACEAFARDTTSS